METGSVVCLTLVLIKECAVQRAAALDVGYVTFVDTHQLSAAASWREVSSLLTHSLLF